MPSVEHKFGGIIRIERETEIERCQKISQINEESEGFIRAVSDVLETRVYLGSRRLGWVEQQLNERTDAVDVIWWRFINNRKPKMHSSLEKELVESHS